MLTHKHLKPMLLKNRTILGRGIINNSEHLLLIKSHTQLYQKQSWKFLNMELFLCFRRLH